MINSKILLALSTGTLALLILGGCLNSADKEKLTAPAIVSEPVESQTVDTGATVKIGIKATGSKLKYVWLMDGDTVGTSDTLVLTHVGLDDAGFYSCIVYNDLLAVGSELSALVVRLPVDTISTGSGNLPANSKVLVSSTSQVLQNVSPVGSTPGLLTTFEVDTYCDDGTLVTDSDTLKTRYLISGGHLSLWEDGDCFTTKFSGSSSTIVGTWTAQSLVSADSVPLAYRAQCADNSAGDLFDSASVEYKISSTQVKAEISANFCYARSIASIFEDSETDYETVSDGCLESKVRNVQQNKVATFTSSYKNDSVFVKFSYGNKVCTGALYLGLATTPTSCSASDEESMDEYFECIFASGFDEGLAKRQSLHKSMLKALKPDLGGPF